MNHDPSTNKFAGGPLFESPASLSPSLSLFLPLSCPLLGSRPLPLSFLCVLPPHFDFPHVDCSPDLLCLDRTRTRESARESDWQEEIWVSWTCVRLARAARLAVNVENKTWHYLGTIPPDFSTCLCINMPANLPSGFDKITIVTISKCYFGRIKLLFNECRNPYADAIEVLLQQDQITIL